jgi:hypothetical protein
MFETTRLAPGGPRRSASFRSEKSCAVAPVRSGGRYWSQAGTRSCSMAANTCLASAALRWIAAIISAADSRCVGSSTTIAETLLNRPSFSPSDFVETGTRQKSGRSGSALRASR